jgi:hypothetical protein
METTKCQEINGEWYRKTPRRNWWIERDLGAFTNTSQYREAKKAVYEGVVIDAQMTTNCLEVTVAVNVCHEPEHDGGSDPFKGGTTELQCCLAGYEADQTPLEREAWLKHHGKFFFKAPFVQHSEGSRFGIKEEEMKELQAYFTLGSKVVAMVVDDFGMDAKFFIYMP